MASGLKYRRIMLKLSGEVFLGNSKNIDFLVVQHIADEIAEIKKIGVQIAVVIGGGNIWRFRDFQNSTLERVDSDTFGMLATVMNSVALQSCMQKVGVKAVTASSVHIPQIVENYVRRSAVSWLEDGKVVICAGGTGNPFFTTDSAAALRALELNCNVMLKATKVDYVYDSDPKKNPKAHLFKKITYDQVLEQNLKVLDATCVSLCRDGNLPIIVFNMEKKGNIKKVVRGEEVGTIITN